MSANVGERSPLIQLAFAVPDLAFSELHFLNAPRPSPPASLHSSSSQFAAPHRSSKPHPTVKTYSSKPKKHRSSKYFDAAPLSDPFSDLPAPTPARKSKSRKAPSKAEPSTRSRPLPPSPPRAPTPKKSKGKTKRKASLPPSSPLHITDSSELHSAYSREQRRSRSAQQEARQSQAHAQQLEEVVLDTSNFWKRDRTDHQHQQEMEAASEVVQVRSAPPASDSRPSSPTAAAAPAPAHTLDYNPNYALSPSRSSASIDRLQACEAGVYPPAVAPPPRPHHPASIVGDADSRVSSGLGMGAFHTAPGRASHHGQSSLRFSSLAGSSTEDVRREVARGVVLGEGGVFRLAESSQGRDGDRTFEAAGGESGGEGKSSMLGAGPEVGRGGSAWMEVPMDAHSLVPTEGDEDDLHFDRLTSLADEDPMLPPPRPASHALDLFSHRQQYQREQDSYLGFAGGGAFGGGSAIRGEASAEVEAFRSAMKSHWYKSKC